MGAARSKPPARDLGALRADLHKRQQEYHSKWQLATTSAREQIQLGNREGALNMLRHAQSLKEQATNLAGMVTNVDAQVVAIENRRITNETVAVMRECARNVGREIFTQDDAAAAVDSNEEFQDEMADMMAVLAAGRGTVSDDELLAGLDSVEIGVAEAPSASTDEAFMTWAAARARDAPSPPPTSFPAVPTAHLHPPAYSASDAPAIAFEL